MAAKLESAGLLMFTRSNGGIEIFLVHPGGPFFKKKDEGYWTIPKGLSFPDEDLLETAVREFEEETGIEPEAPFIPLGSTRQKGGKNVHCWAFEKKLPVGYQLVSNVFELEWPPKSGKKQSFQEVDKAQYFSLQAACGKINQAQVVFIERLQEYLQSK